MFRESLEDLFLLGFVEIEQGDEAAEVVVGFLLDLGGAGFRGECRDSRR